MELYTEYRQINSGKDKTGLKIISPIHQNDAIGLFLPGRWQNSATWAIKSPEQDIRFFLANRGFTIATLDYRSHFLSASEEGRHNLKDVSLSDYVADVHAAIDFLNSICRNRFFVFGFSFGAALALLAHRSRGPVVSGFVALDGGFRAATTQRLQICEQQHPALLINPALRKNTVEMLNATMGKEANSSRSARLAALSPNLGRLTPDALTMFLSMDDIGLAYSGTKCNPYLTLLKNPSPHCSTRSELFEHRYFQSLRYRTMHYFPIIDQSSLQSVLRRKATVSISSWVGVTWKFCAGLMC